MTDITKLYTQMLKHERSWWHVRREFYDRCRQMTRAELTQLWDAELHDLTVAHFQNTDVYPAAFEVDLDKRYTRRRWQANVNTRKYDILRRAKDAAKHRRPRKNYVQSEEHTSGMASDVVINPVRDDHDQTVDKLLGVITRLPDEARDELLRRLGKLYGKAVAA